LGQQWEDISGVYGGAITTGFSEFEVLGYGQCGEYAAILGNQARPMTSQRVGSALRYDMIIDGDCPLRPVAYTKDGGEQGGFSHSIATDNTDDFAFTNFKINALDEGYRPISAR